MKINGKEYGFKLTVGASVQIAKFCPNNDLARIGEAIGENYVAQAETMANIIFALNNGYAASEEFEGRKANRLTVEGILSLSPTEFANVAQRAMKSFVNDIDGEIEVESEKKAAAEG